uniref:Zona pellucida sperm-binding protein 3 n=1 Tax=Electrophorus electricus TaxID=8005 RepID=A0AAY5EAT8_ELEEL
MYLPRAYPQTVHLLPTQEPIPVPNVAADTQPVVQPSPKVKDNDTKLPWKFPTVQGEPKHPLVHSELQEQPRAAQSIAVKCGENAVQVEVKRDFFGTGQWVDPSSITLGGCAVTAEDPAAGVLVFHSALQGCNSMTRISCLSSVFADDWKFERPSNVYFLGEVMNIEASVTQFHHVPLRVFVDNCVASASHNMKADPRYSFIENHGCFIDGKIANSSFLPRLHDGELQFHLETFQFQQDTALHVQVYITCMLKATPVSSPTDVEHKACSFVTNGWLPADDNQVCNCCNTKCEYSLTFLIAGLQWEAEATIGPIVVLEK